MEFISTLCFLLCVSCMLAAPTSFLIWMIFLITKNKKKKYAKYVFLSTLGGILLFAIIGVATFEECEHNWETIEETKATCTNNGSTIKYCNLCDIQETEETPAFGHTWVETIVTPAKCEVAGYTQLACSSCGNLQEEDVPPTGHTWIDATCTAPKTCAGCDATEGDPIGHTTDAGVCSRCNTANRKQSPVTFIGMRHTIDYVGGVEWNFRIRNNSDKEIKYIVFQWTCYNAVGDPVRDEITGKTYVKLRFTGPLAPGETTTEMHNINLFYNPSYSKLRWNEISVEYMDGTIESINEYYDGYYEQ